MDENNKNGFETFTKSVVKLTEDFAAMQTTQTKLKQDVGTVQGETLQLREEVIAVNTRVDETDSKIEVLKEATANKFRELEAAFLAKVQSLPVKFPALTIGQQLTVNERFESLRAQAKACRNVFVLGNVPDYGSSVPLKSVIMNFFPTCGMRLMPKAGKTKVWRVTVPLDKIEETKKIAEANVFSIRDHGWWIQQDLPPKLRQMHSNAYAFIKLVREKFLRVRPFLFEADDGYLVVEKTAIVPVYLVPKKKDKWEELATVLASEIGALVESEWLENVVANNIDKERILEKWCAVLGVEVSCGQIEAEALEVDESTDGNSQKKDGGG